MPEKKHRNPFEDHINSESFDVSNLGSVQERSPMDREMQEFFDSLPNELDHTLWDNELDERQKAISAYLTTELAERILRQEHGELLEDISNSQLIHIINVPVTLAMMAEQRLHRIEEHERKTVAAPALSSYDDEYAELPPNFADVLNEWFLKAKDFIINLFRRK
jgi:hypothetical protein